MFPTRAQAKAACDGGKVDINGSRAKSHRDLKVGDRLTITTAGETRRQLVVRSLADRSIPKAQARALYDDVTPPLSPEILEARRLDRMMASAAPDARPDRRERREIIRRKGR